MATPNNAPSINSLNGAMVIGTTKFNPSKFTDLNWLYSNYTKDSQTVYKGLLAMWNQRSIINTPLLNMTELKNNVMYLPNMEGRFTYSIPYDLGLPYIVEDMTDATNTKPGLDGQPFQIKLSENCYSNTDRIVADLRDGIELYITEDEIYEENGYWVYTVTLANTSRRNSFYPKEWLQPGTQYLKMSNINGEYDTQKSTISMDGLRTGFMELQMELGTGQRSISHWVTGWGDMAKLDDKAHPHLAYINQRLGGMGSTTMYMNTDQKGNALPNTMRWQSTIEMLLRADMEMMTERDLMWGKGGYVEGSGRRKVRVGAGLYEQLRNGNRYTYNTISLTLIENAVANLYSKSGIPLEQRKTKIMTGTGGLIQISKELEDRFAKLNIPFQLTNVQSPINDIIYGKDAMNMGFKMRRWTSYFSQIAGEITFELNPALDNVTGNRNSDNLIGEYPIESYTYMILDVTDTNVTNATARVKDVQYRVEDGFNTGSNIVLVKPQDLGELYWGYICGTHSPLGPAGMKGMASTSHRDGYEIWMKSFASIWVKDCTRTLLIEKARPSYLTV